MVQGPPNREHADADPGADDSSVASEARLENERLKMHRFRFTTTRPVGVLMVFLAMLVFGVVSVGRLPVNLMPEISYPKLTVRTEYPGAAPAEVENDVARPLEEVLGVVKGVTKISSVARAGYCDVILEFSWDSDMDEANQDVLEKLDVVKPLLPEEVKQPLILRYDPTLDPVLVLSLSGDDERYRGISGLKALRRVGDQQVQRLLEPVDGVAAVKIKGGLEEEIHVEIDEAALRRTKLSIATVIQRLQAENINLAGGSMREGKTRYLIRTVNEFVSLDQIRDLVVVSVEGKDIKLSHVATVEHGFKDRDVITRVEGHEAVEVEIYKEADANIVEMAARVRQRIEGQGVQGHPDAAAGEGGVAKRLLEEFGVELRTISDRSLFIESSITEVRNTAFGGGLLAVIVLFFFLRKFKATAIVAIAIPVSLLITFAPMNLQGVSLNIMSLGGMALGIGMLVDNSIVVLESIHRCIEEGDALKRAVLRGVSEVGSAVIASTLTSIAVFAPMVFVEGVAGQMFGDLGATVVFSLLASLAVALFLIPTLTALEWPSKGEDVGLGVALRRRWTRWESIRALVVAYRGDRRATRTRRVTLRVLFSPYFCSRFVFHLVAELAGKILVTAASGTASVVFMASLAVGRLLALLALPVLHGFAWILERLERIYVVMLRWSLQHGAAVLALVLAMLVFVGRDAADLDTELIPEVHQAEFSVEIVLPVGTPLKETERVVRPIEEDLRARIPRLRSLVTTIGSERDSTESGERGEHTATMAIAVWTAASPNSARDDGLLAPLDSVTPEIAESDALVVVREVLSGIPDLDARVSRPVLFSFKTPIEIEIRGYDLSILAVATRAVETRLTGIAGLRDVKGSIQPGNPEIQIIYDRDALARRGLDIRTVAELVRDKVQGQEATKFNRGDRKVPVRVRLADVETTGVDEIRNLVVNPGGLRPIPLSAVAKIKPGRGPNEIRRVGQQRVGIVSANVEGVGLGNATDAVITALAVIDLPPGISTVVTGQSEEWKTSSASLLLALGLSIFLVYVIMASQFESVVYPLIILVTIPLALIGVIVALKVLSMPVSVVVFLGGIMLAGIVVNNAIVLVDYINQLKARGKTTSEAIEIAGAVRLRPILMTTMTTVLGLLPMALGLGDGAEIRQPMAVTVIAGLSVSTVLTLIVIPTLYSLVDRVLGARVGSDPMTLLAHDLAEVRTEQLTPDTDVSVTAAEPPVNER